MRPLFACDYCSVAHLLLCVSALVALSSRLPPAPAAPPAETQSPETAFDNIAAIRRLIIAGQIDIAGVRGLGETGDVRHAWYVSEVLRLFRGDNGVLTVDAFERLAGVDIKNDPESERSPWLGLTNHLIAGDTPAYPAYPAYPDNSGADEQAVLRTKRSGSPGVSSTPPRNSSRSDKAGGTCIGSAPAATDRFGWFGGER